MNIKSCFVIPKPNPKADLKLICFPYAGGSPHVFVPWVNELSPSVELVIMQAPGRGNRLFEQSHTNMDSLISELIKEIGPHLSKPYVYFGHSLGSRVAFELMMQTKKHGYALPKHFIASGSRGPDQKCMKETIFNLPYDEFIKKLINLNGTPHEVLKNRELMELLLPSLRADFEIAETYCYKGSEKFDCPISVFGGKEDTITLESLNQWSEFFSQPANIIQMLGGHFFIDSHRELVLRQVNQILNKKG